MDVSILVNKKKREVSGGSLNKRMILKFLVHCILVIFLSTVCTLIVTHTLLYHHAIVKQYNKVSPESVHSIIDEYLHHLNPEVARALLHVPSVQDMDRALTKQKNATLTYFQQHYCPL